MFDKYAPKKNRIGISREVNGQRLPANSQLSISPSQSQISYSGHMPPHLAMQESAAARRFLDNVMSPSMVTNILPINQALHQ